MLKYAMLEISGKCSRSCPLCLPKKRKTGVAIRTDRFFGVTDQLKAAGVKKITIAGFGNPVSHPKFDVIGMGRWMGEFESTITCRVEDLPMVYHFYRANVSVDGIGDVRKLIGVITRPNGGPLPAKIVPHIVLTHDLSFEIENILRILWTWESRFERITVASPVALCDDKNHLQAIAEATSTREVGWKSVRRLIGELGASRVECYDASPRWKTCSWPASGVYINARLDTLPCCYLPVSEPFGNLGEQTLAEVYAGEKWTKFRETWNKEGSPCLRCPRTGG